MEVPVKETKQIGVRGKTRLRVTTLLAALSVRSLLLLHNILAVWRVVISRDDNRYWSLAVGNIFLLIETLMVVMRNGGNEWKWWCPCFLSYLMTTFPSIWLLQLSQYHQATTGPTTQSNSSGVVISGALVMTTENTMEANITTTSEAPPSTTQFVILRSIDDILKISDTTWIVMIQESLVYLIVFGRWILPRANVSRKDLSDLLLEYLGMASDIMELYALFDEDVVLTHLGVTYAILTIWSISFMQFIPVLVHKSARRSSAREQRIAKACGEHFHEVFFTSTSIFLQDGPFLCLRLYIIIDFQLVTYSLIFFALKNVVSVLLLLYRLVVLCVRLPCCYKGEGRIHEVQDVDFSLPVYIVPPKKPVLSKQRSYLLGSL